jgi:type I site-specific restriction-modification system R (restriction) subunit
MSTLLLESVVEEAAIEWLQGLGYQYLPGPDIACDGPHHERGSYADVVLEQRLRDALARLNPALPAETLEDAFRKITRPEGPTLDGAQSRHPPLACGRRHGGVPNVRRHHPRSAGAGAGF